jgi:enolase
MIIKGVKARKIKNSREEDTIEISINSSIGRAKASAPAGKSKGKYEKKYYDGTVDEVIKKVNSFDKLKGVEINKYDDLKKIEKVFDFGSNPNIALEYAILKNFKKPYKKFNFGYRSLPVPLGNVIGGGLHTKNTKKPDFQEFLIYVENCKDFVSRVKINRAVYLSILKKLKPKRRNDEGAWIVNLSNGETLEILKGIADELSYRLGYRIRIGLDVAASSFFKDGKYNYENYAKNKKQVKLSKDEQIDFLVHLVEKYKIGYLEDPLHEEDFEGFKELRKRVKDCLVVGDDLTVTNLERVKMAKGCVDGIVIKPNQIGSLIEVEKVVEFCKLNKIKTIFSHRSGETSENFLADLSYIFGADFIKAGVYGKERIVKYSRLRKIR